MDDLITAAELLTEIKGCYRALKRAIGYQQARLWLLTAERAASADLGTRVGFSREHIAKIIRRKVTASRRETDAKVR